LLQSPTTSREPHSDELFAGIILGQIGGERVDLDTVARPELAREVLEPGLVACDERQVVTPPRQLAGEFGSEGACDGDG